MHSQPLSSSHHSLCREVTNTLASGRGSMLADGGLEEELLVQGAKYPTSLNPAQCFTSSLPAAVFCFLSNCVTSSSSSVLQEKYFFHENFSLSVQGHFILPLMTHTSSQLLIEYLSIYPFIYSSTVSIHLSMSPPSTQPFSFLLSVFVCPFSNLIISVFFSFPHGPFSLT